MKKILLATTVLVAASAAAHAEVTLSGDARMGVTAGGGADAKFSSRARVKFTAAVETDGGLSLGASFRAQDAAGAAAGTSGAVSISGAFGSLSMGDNDSAANTVVGNVSAVGYTDLGSLNELGYLGGATTNVLYTYTAGAVTFAASAGQLGLTPAAAVVGPPAVAAVDADSMSIGAKYSTDAYSVALGYETEEQAVAGSVDQLSFGASATFAGATLKLVAMDRSSNADVNYAASVDYTISGIGVTAFATSTETYGLGGSYSLGGGAAFKAGAVKAAGAKPTYDAGVTFSF